MADTTPLSLDDYEAIADAVQETERGRWFLAEYARRNRAADTATVLEALAGLERRLAGGEGKARFAIRNVEQALRAARMALAKTPEETALRLTEVERLLEDVLEALGSGRSADADSAQSQIDAQPVPLALTPPPAETDVAWVDLARFEHQLLSGAEDEDIQAVDAQPAVPETDPPPSPVAEELGSLRFIPATPAPANGAAHVNGAAINGSGINGAHSAHVPAVQRRRLPAADMPGLLDRLSDDEKAILFA